MLSEDNRSGDPKRIDWMEIFSIVTTFFLFNMLWLFGSVFIVTIPAVTAALFASVSPWTREETPYQPLTLFARATRRLWLKATLIALLDLIIGGIVLLNILILWQTTFSQNLIFLLIGSNLFVSLLLIVTNTYLWPLMATVDLPLFQLIKESVRMALSHPLWGILVALAATTPLVVSLFLPGFFFLTITFAASALIMQWGAGKVLQRYYAKHDIQSFGV